MVILVTCSTSNVKETEAFVASEIRKSGHLSKFGIKHLLVYGFYFNLVATIVIFLGAMINFVQTCFPGHYNPFSESDVENGEVSGGGVNMRNIYGQ